MRIEHLESRRLLAAGEPFAFAPEPFLGDGDSDSGEIVAPAPAPAEGGIILGRPPTDIDLSNTQILENNLVGSVVGVFATSDPDNGESFLYQFVDGDGGQDNSLFSIDGDQLRTAVVFDYEAGGQYSIRVRSTDDGNQSLEDVFLVQILDVDEFDVGDVTDGDPVANAVFENVPVGTEVGITVLAEDADGTATITFSLGDSAEGRFAIDPGTGIVTVALPLDAESATGHTIVVRATSSDTSWSETEFTVLVVDENEYSVGYVIDSDDSANVVSELAAVGTPVGITAQAYDDDVSDDVSYFLSDDADGRFRIDADTGVVSVARHLDAETASRHTIRIQAVSTDGSVGYVDCEIQVADRNEFSVDDVQDVDEAANIVPEDAPLGTTVGIVASAGDGDLSDAVWYSLTDSADGRFAIEPWSGVVTVAAALDAETNASHTIRIRASSTDGSSSEGEFTIRVADRDEFPIGELNDVDASVNEVLESAFVGTPVGITARATDEDAFDLVSYRLVNDAGGRFAVAAETGVVTVAGPLDAETTEDLRILVQAASTDGSSRVAEYTISILDVDEADVGVVSDVDTLPNEILTNAVAGTIVGITAFAADEDISDSVHYALIDDAEGRFGIDSATGVVTLATTLQDLARMESTISIQAISSDGSTSVGDFAVTVIPVQAADACPWQNPFDPCDVNRDGVVSPMDVLLLINEINKTGPHGLPPLAEGEQPPLYFDVNGDGALTAADVLFIINRINEDANEVAQGAEQEPADAPSENAASLSAGQRVESPLSRGFLVAANDADESTFNIGPKYEIAPMDADEVFSMAAEPSSLDQHFAESDELIDYLSES